MQQLFDRTSSDLVVPAGSGGKESAFNVGDVGCIVGREDPLEEEMAAHSAILPGESHGKRSLVGYSL